MDDAQRREARTKEQRETGRQTASSESERERGRKEGREGGRGGGWGGGRKRETERARERASERASERESQQRQTWTDRARKERPRASERDSEDRQRRRRGRRRRRRRCAASVREARSDNSCLGMSAPPPVRRAQRWLRPSALTPMQGARRRTGVRQGQGYTCSRSSANRATGAALRHALAHARRMPRYPPATPPKIEMLKRKKSVQHATRPTRSKTVSTCREPRPLRPERAQSEILDAHAYRVSGVDLSSLFTRSALFLTVERAGAERNV